MTGRDELTRRYCRLLSRAWDLMEDPGLSAAVYTQITDVETECNGLLTYDREVVKLDAEKAAAANRGEAPRLEVRDVVASPRLAPQSGRYTFEKPADTWRRPDFDDASWTEGKGGFGTQGTPGAVVRTEWRTADIWLRRSFTLPDDLPAGLMLLVH